MGRIIDRRRVMGGKLPYDAEIEYLESSGTQYIDTRIVPNTRLAVTIDLQRLGKEAADEVPIGGRISIYYDYSIWTGPLGKGFAAHYCNGKKPPTSYDTKYVYTGDITDRFYLVTVSNVGLTVDGNTVYTFPEIPFLEGGGESLAIFTLKNNGAFDSRTFKGRIKKVVIELDGIIVRDYIPVRVGTVGYMYDKVSGQLFGNAGTGEFILGPDKLGGGVNP